MRGGAGVCPGRAKGALISALSEGDNLDIVCVFLNLVDGGLVVSSSPSPLAVACNPQFRSKRRKGEKKRERKQNENNKIRSKYLSPIRLLFNWPVSSAASNRITSIN